jgi:hypothetical protein
MTGASIVERHLAGQGIDDAVLSHPLTGSSSATAEAADVSGNCIAKTVALRDSDVGPMCAAPGSWLATTALSRGRAPSRGARSRR